jgi:hypothetical protein
MNAGRSLSALVLVAACVGVPSCFTDNPAAYQGILGPTREPPEDPNPPSGGKGGGGAGGLPAGNGGASAGSGGTGEGGESGEHTAAGTSGRGGGASGRGGSGAGTSGTGGADVNPPEDPNFAPACFRGPTVSGGEEIKKGTSCTDEDTQLCYRPCGPNQVGWKTETCVAGVYAEGDCTFPMDKDYSCYKIPDDIDEGACGLSAPPAATAECTAPACMSCNFDGFYEDTGSDVKEGFCVCREPDMTGKRRWTCASAVAWPCPLNQGC